MRELLRPMLIMGAVLAIPIVPFLLFGEQMEAWVTEWTKHPPAPLPAASIIVALLASDILLPVPSSLISTMAGVTLGKLFGTLTSWLGMTLGAIFGFGLARRFGHRIVTKLSKEDALARTEQLTDRLGPLVLVVTRGVPVFAEASVLLFGLHRMTWRRFLPPVVLSNLGLSLAYAMFGDYAQRHQWLPLALAVSIALPVILTLVTRFVARPQSKQL